MDSDSLCGGVAEDGLLSISSVDEHENRFVLGSKVCFETVCLSG